MAKITIDSIRKELELTGWNILSKEYVNLNSELTFECPEGHEVISTWKKIRARQECPICKANVLKDQREVIVPKKNACRVLALDQSTHTTGWAIFDNQSLVRYGIFESKGLTETARINNLKHWLMTMIANWNPDCVGIEGIQFQEEVADGPKMGVTVFQALARCQGVLIDTCFEAKISFEVCPTNTWRAFNQVKGRSRTDKKKSMQLIVKNTYDVTVSNDEADAIGIGRYLASFSKPAPTIENWE